jgi:hypothetical protein
MRRRTSSGRGNIHTYVSVLVEQHKKSIVRESNGGVVAREFELASARARLGQDAVAVG